MAKLRTMEKHFPDYNNIVTLSQEAVMSRLNCHNIGRIIEFNPENQTCSIQLMQLKQLGNEIYTPAPLTDVPLIIYGASGAHITLPDPVGSICLVLFLDRNIDAFLQTGELYTPETARMHDFTDCVALTTFTTLADALENYDTEAISIAYNKIIDGVLYNSVIKNYGDGIVLKVETEENATQIVLNDKINLQNSTQNMNLLINELIESIKGLVISTTSGVVTQDSQDKLQDISNKFSELLI